MRELTKILDFPVKFVEPGDPEGLLAAIVEFYGQLREQPLMGTSPALDRISPKAVGQKFLEMLEDFETRP